MPDLREIQRKLESIKALQEIVDAMRNLAATYVRRAEKTLDAIRPYADVAEAALQVTLDAAGVQEIDPAENAPVFALVFASDQGLCGAYNDRVIRSAVKFRESTAGEVHVAAVGHRGRGLLELRGVEPMLAAGAPTSLEGIRAQVPDLAAEVLDAYTQRGAGEMFFIYNRYAGMGRYEETVQRVLPPTREQLASGETPEFPAEPILTAPCRELLTRFIDEYFFIELYRALLESHASENGARLLAMTAASSNIDERLAELTQEFQSVRQDSITAELLDVVGGAEALRE